MLLETITLILLLVISAFFSASEIAYIAANKIKVEVKAKKNNLAAKNALYFIRKPQEFFTTILIGNNIVNISFSSIITVMLTLTFRLEEGTILVISTLLVLLFGELLPKYLSREAADSFVLISAVPVRIFSFLLYPFVKIINIFNKFFNRDIAVKEDSVAYLFSKKDIQLLVKESREAGAVNTRESSALERILQLRDQRVYESMRPRTEIIAVDIESPIDEALNVFIESGFSKIPVYEENIDNIKGVILAYDLFKSPKNVRDIMKDVIYVPDTKKTIEMLNEFLRKRASIAIVVDEFGGTAGLITGEDIIEEIFGEIKDEYDIDEEINRKVDEDSYIIGGKVEIDAINEKFNLNIPKSDYETIGGFITYHLGRIPAKGESVVIGDFRFLIIKANQIRIDLVKMYIDKQPELF
ncbi:MAG TPA: hemolysin family protein [Ignavibacteriales bacterium]|nr:hemolysin family protein [Ignavibacteriales bacterium]